MPTVVSPPGVMLNAVADPTDAILVDAYLSDTPDTGGSVRPYGGGRLRWVQGPAVMRQVPLSIDTVSPAQLAWLEAHKGVLLWFRDPFGRRYAVVYSGFTATPFPSGAAGYHSVTGLTLRQVTRFESV